MLVGSGQRELGQFFAKVARWANRLHKSDAKVNLFKKDCEFDTAQKFFEFFNEDRQEAKLDAMTFLGDGADEGQCGGGRGGGGGGSGRGG